MARLFRRGLFAAALLLFAGCADVPESLASADSQPAATTTTTSTVPATGIEAETTTTVVEDEVVAVITDDTGFDEAGLAAITGGDPNRLLPDPLTVDELNQLMLDEMDITLGRYDNVAWTPELRASTLECFSSYLISLLADEKLIDSVELDLILTSTSPLSKAFDELEEALVQNESQDEVPIRLNECFGSAEDFVFIFTSDWVDPETRECLATDLTRDQRIELRQENSPWHREWTDLLDECGWVDPDQ